MLNIFEGLGITAYHDHGNIDLYDLGLHPKKKEEHVEFDIAAVVGTVGIIVEAKRKTEKNLKEMKRFLLHARKFAFDSTIPIENKIRLLKGIPPSKRKDFLRIEKWRFVFASDKAEIIENDLRESRVGHSAEFFVLNRRHIRYLKFLAKNLGTHGKYELFNKLKIDFKDAGIRGGSQTYEAIRAARRKISKSMGVADLYLFMAPVSDLLKMSRVDRYGSLENWTPELGEKSYQRILSGSKLEDIHEFVKVGKEQTSFPNTITVIMNAKEMEYNNPSLKVDINYGYFDIIDGQHRLFGFAKSRLDEARLDKTYLPVTGVHFPHASKSKISKWNAQTFVEINSTQKKVPTELIYLIKFSVMGQRTPEALSTHALKELNTVSDSPLYTIFKTAQLSERSRFGKSPIKIVTIANELRPLFTPAGKTKAATAREALQVLDDGKKLLNSFFGAVSNIFKEDWSGKPASSLIFTTNYIAGFCKVLAECNSKGLSKNETKQKLLTLKRNMQNSLRSHDPSDANRENMLGPNTEVFWKENTVLPVPQNLPAIKKLLLEKAELET